MGKVAVKPEDLKLIFSLSPPMLFWGSPSVPVLGVCSATVLCAHVSIMWVNCFSDTVDTPILTVPKLGSHPWQFHGPSLNAIGLRGLPFASRDVEVPGHCDISYHHVLFYKGLLCGLCLQTFSCRWAGRQSACPLRPSEVLTQDSWSLAAEETWCFCGF